MSLPPGPRAPMLVQTANFGARGVDFLRSCQRRYGDVFTLRLAGFGRLAYVADPAVIKRVFTGDPGELRAGEANSFMEPILGPRSLLLLDGDEHMRMRKLMLPAFHGESVKRYGDLIEQVTLDELRRWPVGERFALRPRMQAITLAVIAKAVFGVSESGSQRMLELLRHMVEPPTAMIYIPWLRRRFGGIGPWARFLRRRDELDALIEAEIERRRADPQLESRDDILSMLLRAHGEDGEGLSNGELRDELMTLLIAGHETTATGLAWAFERLLRHPSALERLRSELEDGESTKYMDAVIRETLRVRPVVIDVARVVKAPFEIGAHTMRPGDLVVPVIALVQSSDREYGDAAEFRPERFLEDSPSPYTWIPFGGGVRRCLGAAFATFEMKTVLATVLRHAELRAGRPDPERVKLNNVTLIPSRDSEVVLERRHGAGAAATRETAGAAV
jgi:cytochrome P450